MQAFNQDPEVKAIVLDSPLLYEAGLDKYCDVVIFVNADPHLRRKRACQYRGWDQHQLGRREKLQIPVDMKRSRAEYIIENNSELKPLRQEVERIFHQIRDA